MKNCRPFASFHEDKSILATKTNGKLGNQMSAFATLYAGGKITRDKLRVGLNFKQLQILARAFPYFENNFDKFLMDSWYCVNPKTLAWTFLGKALQEFLVPLSSLEFP